MPRQPEKSRKAVKLPYGQNKSTGFDPSKLRVAVAYRAMVVAPALLLEKAPPRAKRKLRLRKEEP